MKWNYLLLTLVSSLFLASSVSAYFDSTSLQAWTDKDVAAKRQSLELKVSEVELSPQARDYNMFKLSLVGQELNARGLGNQHVQFVPKDPKEVISDGAYQYLIDKFNIDAEVVSEHSYLKVQFNNNAHLNPHAFFVFAREASIAAKQAPTGQVLKTARIEAQGTSIIIEQNAWTNRQVGQLCYEDIAYILSTTKPIPLEDLIEEYYEIRSLDNLANHMHMLHSSGTIHFNDFTRVFTKVFPMHEELFTDFLYEPTTQQRPLEELRGEYYAYADLEHLSQHISVTNPSINNKVLDYVRPPVGPVNYEDLDAFPRASEESFVVLVDGKPWNPAMVPLLSDPVEMPKAPLISLEELRAARYSAIDLQAIKDQIYSKDQAGARKAYQRAKIVCPEALDDLDHYLNQEDFHRIVADAFKRVTDKQGFNAMEDDVQQHVANVKLELELPEKIRGYQGDLRIESGIERELRVVLMLDDDSDEDG